METVTIFIFDHLLPAGVMALLLVNIRAMLTRKSKPKYYAGQQVLGQNYKTKAGDYVPCTITGVSTIWHTNNNYEHMYTVQVVGANISLELNQDRIKPIA